MYNNKLNMKLDRDVIISFIPYNFSTTGVTFKDVLDVEDHNNKTTRIFALVLYNMPSITGVKSAIRFMTLEGGC